MVNHFEHDYNFFADYPMDNSSSLLGLNELEAKYLHHALLRLPIDPTDQSTNLGPTQSGNGTALFQHTYDERFPDNLRQQGFYASITDMQGFPFGVGDKKLQIALQMRLAQADTDGKQVLWSVWNERADKRSIMVFIEGGNIQVSISTDGTAGTVQTMTVCPMSHPNCRFMFTFDRRGCTWFAAHRPQGYIYPEEDDYYFNSFPGSPEIYPPAAKFCIGCCDDSDPTHLLAYNIKYGYKGEISQLKVWNTWTGQADYMNNFYWQLIGKYHLVTPQNKFLRDSSCIAVYPMDDGARAGFGTDVQGNEIDLGTVWIPGRTYSTFGIRGYTALRVTGATAFYLVDSEVPRNFPLVKDNTNPNNNFTFCGWFHIDTIAENSTQTFLYKHNCFKFWVERVDTEIDEETTETEYNYWVARYVRWFEDESWHEGWQQKMIKLMHFTPGEMIHYFLSYRDDEESIIVMAWQWGNSYGDWIRFRAQGDPAKPICTIYEFPWVLFAAISDPEIMMVEEGGFNGQADEIVFFNRALGVSDAYKISQGEYRQRWPLTPHIVHNFFAYLPMRKAIIEEE